MSRDIEFMCKIYGTYRVDWLGDKIHNNLTKHHIVKQENDGENGISNYALLTTRSHKFLHYLEENHNDAYLALNALLLKVNRSCKPPTVEHYEKVKAIIKRVNKKIKIKKYRF